MSVKFSLALIVVILGMIGLIKPTNGVEYAEDHPEHYLIPHNKAREELGVAPLEWDPQLAEYAYQTASQHGVNCELEHSTGPYAENIAGGTGPIMTGTDATNMWVGEKQWYDPNTKTCEEGKVCGHYTNIIEPATHKLGCAKIVCPNDGLIFQCDYAR